MRVVAAGAGFSGDRIDPAVVLAASGEVQDVVLECLAERTLVQGLRARASDPDAGHDRRLRRRLVPLLPAAREHGCRIVTNLGAANPAAAARETAALAGELGLAGIRVAAVVGDDVLAQAHTVDWGAAPEPPSGLLGAHAYLGYEPIAAALGEGADVVITGRAADSALFAGPLAEMLEDEDDALAGALVVGHLLECGGQITGGNFLAPGGGSLPAEDLARLGYPLARVQPDGSAEIGKLAGTGGRIDRLTCTLQLLYEVHDPARYLTPDGIVDFSGVAIEEAGPDRVHVSGARLAGRTPTLKVSGFVEEPGATADVEIAYAGSGALDRARTACEVLRLRLEGLGIRELAVDIVGVDAVLGPASRPPACEPAEVRAHVSAICPDRDLAQAVEDEVYALTLDGPANGAGMRSELRPRVRVVDGLLSRDLTHPELTWEVST